MAHPPPVHIDIESPESLAECYQKLNTMMLSRSYNAYVKRKILLQAAYCLRRLAAICYRWEPWSSDCALASSILASEAQSCKQNARRRRRS